jgi:glycopeptide antibiotics resistance protein
MVQPNLKDVAINIIGFVHLGFFFPAWLRRVKNLPAPSVYGITLLIGICLSLAVELVQVYLPARDSSLMDVFSNILGTALGVFIFEYALPDLMKS